MCIRDRSPAAHRSAGTRWDATPGPDGRPTSSGSTAPAVPPGTSSVRRAIHSEPLRGLPLRRLSGEHRDVDLYFSLGASRRRGFLTFIVGSDTIKGLQTGQAYRPVAGYFKDRLPHEVRRNAPVPQRSSVDPRPALRSVDVKGVGPRPNQPALTPVPDHRLEDGVPSGQVGGLSLIH